MQSPESGIARAAYLATAKALRRVLDGTSFLERWTESALANPRTRSSHLRTLLAVHNADDLVRLDLPWWSYRAIDIVEEFLAARKGKARVFEYGSGASTLWLARRAGSLDSVEHVPAWAGRVEDMIAHVDNLQCHPRIHVPSVPASHDPRIRSDSPSGTGLDFFDYVNAIENVPGPFDLILVDGRARSACLAAALRHVTRDGLVLFDDTQRRRYQEAIAGAEARGWRVERERGATPCQPMPRETALLHH